MLLGGGAVSCGSNNCVLGWGLDPTDVKGHFLGLYMGMPTLATVDILDLVGEETGAM